VVEGMAVETGVTAGIQECDRETISMIVDPARRIGILGPTDIIRTGHVIVIPDLIEIEEIAGFRDRFNKILGFHVLTVAIIEVSHPAIIDGILGIRIIILNTNSLHRLRVIGQTLHLLMLCQLRLPPPTRRLLHLTMNNKTFLTEHRHTLHPLSGHRILNRLYLQLRNLRHMTHRHILLNILHNCRHYSHRKQQRRIHHRYLFNNMHRI